MVVSAEVIRSKAIFHVAWVLGTGDARKLTRREILNQNLPDLCNSIIDMVPERDRSYATKAGLYLLSLLTYGTVLIHRVQVEFLQKDVEKLKELMKKKSFIMLIADRFDREQEMLRQEQSRARLRSTPIFSMEDIDDLVNLANLPMISEQLGINGDPRDFTMMDALPNLVQWNEINPDLTGLYGSVEPFSSQNYTMHSTFVEGNGSDEHSKEKRTAAVIHDFEDFVLPQRTIEQKSPIRADSRKRSAFVSDQEQEQRPLVEPAEQAPLFDSTVQNNELPKPVGPEVEPMKFAQWPLIDEVEAPIPLQRSSHDTLQVPLEEPQQVLPAQLEDLDLVNVPASQQEKVAAYLDSINNLPDDSTKLPPLPNDLDLFEEVVPPPAKKQRVGEVELEIEDLEHARRRPSSRPLTPINQTDLTDLHSTVRMDEPILEMDSQIRDILPQRKRSKRNLPFHGDDLEIDVAVQKVLVADWSTLVRKKEEVLVKIPEDPNCASLLMDYPEPVFSLGNKLCKEVREMFKSGSYQEFEGSAVSDIGEEKFGTICLLSPTRNETQNEISQQQQFMFDEEYRPRQFDELNQQVQDDQLVEERRHEGLPLADATMPITNLKYAFKNLLPTPEKQREATIMEDLNLDAIPIAGNLENLDFFNPNNQTLQQGDQFETLRSDDDVENVRRRQKSSLGVRHQRTDHLEEDTLEIARRQRAFEQEERLRLAMEAKEDDMYFFSSGSLLPNNRLMIHEEILKEAEAKYPEWVDFNQFTADHGSKKAATAFEGLLLSLKNMKVQAKQDEPFGTIFVQHIEQ